jgi:hypothetical protein
MTFRPAVLLCLLLAGCTDTPIRPDTGSFDWLTGCWRLERDDGFYEEVWLPAVADGSLGVARNVRKGRTTSHEFMRLELRKDGSIVFFAQPSGQAPAEFRMAEHAPGRLAFENPEHDFPTRVEYRYVGLNAVHARIAGTRDGQTKVIDYPLQRVDCEG